MDCLYEAFVARGFMGGRLTLWPSSLEYLCSNTTEASSSALRRFFLDVLTANFGNPDRIKGTTEEWDKVLANHDDARTCLLGALRTSTSKPLAPVDAYLDKE